MPKSRGTWALLLVVVTPCFLCSGMAALIVGPGFAAEVLGIILLVYLVMAAVGLVTWLSAGRAPWGGRWSSG